MRCVSKRAPPVKGEAYSRDNPTTEWSHLLAIVLVQVLGSLAHTSVVAFWRNHSLVLSSALRDIERLGLLQGIGGSSQRTLHIILQVVHYKDLVIALFHVINVGALEERLSGANAATVPFKPNSLVLKGKKKCSVS